MNHEDYVSLEIAKLLKEKGFDLKCDKQHIEKIPGTEKEEWDEDECQYATIYDIIRTPIPTLWQAAKWLRGKHDLHISVDVYTDSSLDADGRVCEEWIYWDFDVISTLSGRRVVDEHDEYESYEAALSAGIEAALKLI